MVAVNIASIDKLNSDVVGAPDAGTPDLGDLSRDGRYVVYTSGLYDEQIFLYDTVTDAKTIVSISNGGAQGNEDSTAPDISQDGRYVVYASDADNLVPGDDNQATDIFLYDRATGTTERLSVSSGGAEGDGDSYLPDISGDGRYVVFTSEAANLAPGDSGAAADLFLHDTKTGQTKLIAGDVPFIGTPQATISENGRFVTFNGVEQGANGGFATYLYNVKTGVTQVVTKVGAGHSIFADDVSTDGRYVVFTSDDDKLVAGDTNGAGDVFRYDTQTGETVRVSMSATGVQANDGSQSGSISANGRYVMWSSDADNIVAGDENGGRDVFLTDMKTGQVIRVSLGEGGEELDPNGFTGISGEISEDGRSFIVDTLGDVFHGRLDGVAEPVGVTRNGDGRDNLLKGTEFADRFDGKGGNDTIQGGGGADTIDGGDGNDTARYADSGAGVTVNLASGRGSGGTATGDRYTSIENVEGSKFGDELIGDKGKNTLDGDKGNDALDGGLGADRLIGGAGKDAFVFSASLKGKPDADAIADFNVRDDTIHLDDKAFKGLGKEGRLDADLFYSSRAGEAHDRDDRIIYDKDSGKLFYDADGNRGGDAILIARLDDGLSLTAKDFLVV